MLAPDLYLGLQTRGGPAQARYQSAQVRHETGSAPSNAVAVRPVAHLSLWPPQTEARTQPASHIRRSSLTDSSLPLLQYVVRAQGLGSLQPSEGTQPGARVWSRP